MKRCVKPIMNPGDTSILSGKISQPLIGWSGGVYENFKSEECALQAKHVLRATMYRMLELRSAIKNLCLQVRVGTAGNDSLILGPSFSMFLLGPLVPLNNCSQTA